MKGRWNWNGPFSADRLTDKEPVMAQYARTTPEQPRYLADTRIGRSLKGGASFQGWEWPDRRFTPLIEYAFGVDQSGKEKLLRKRD